MKMSAEEIDELIAERDELLALANKQNTTNEKLFEDLQMADERVEQAFDQVIRLRNKLQYAELRTGISVPAAGNTRIEAILGSDIQAGDVVSPVYTYDKEFKTISVAKNTKYVYDDDGLVMKKDRIFLRLSDEKSI